MSRTAPILALLLVSVASVPAADPLPRVPPSWKIELVAQAPEILYPTAIAISRDGTVYLGQDPMDMPGPPTRPIDSVVALKDGKARVFADGLWSVMGLEWVGDSLIVVHAPFLSAFRDADGDGRADQRIDLMTGLGPPVPGFSGINDHVPSGVRLGLDGFLYISFGDKGIPKGVGKDGTTIRVEGGGVIRIRPDGTGLQVVSTGERNPLSVALDAFDEVFTYGNDDDSKKWPNSLTHHIVGGHYGYPYQFLSHPRLCLPILAGQIGGSGTQGVCYLEDGLPDEYRGDLFFCDWGLQEVSRYKVEKAGGTFKLKEKTLFVSKGDVSDFRPFSLGVAPHGDGFYLVDWAFSGWLAQGPKTGRLYKITYEGADRPRPSEPPARGFGLDDLGHPSRTVRLDLQRARKGDNGDAKDLVDFVATHGPILARTNALWILSEQQAPASAEAIRKALNDRDPEIRRQAAKTRGIRKDRAAVPALVKLLKDPDPAVRRESAIALGEIGDPAAVSGLYDALGDADRFAGWSIAHAIRSMKAWDTPKITAALVDPRRRDAALALTEDAWSVAVVDALAAALEPTTDAAVRERIVTNLAGLYHKYPEWSGAWFGTNPLAGDQPRKTKPWSTEGMIQVVSALGKAANDPDPRVRKAALVGLAPAGPAAIPPFLARLAAETDPANQAILAEALGRLHATDAAPTLSDWLADPNRPKSVREAALDALAQLPGRKPAMARLGLLYDRAADPDLMARALVTLAPTGVVPANDLLGFLDHPSPAVRIAAISSATALQPPPPEARQAVALKLDDPASEVRKAAIAACAAMKAREAIPRLIALADQDATRTEATLALAILPDPRALPIYLKALSDRNPDLRNAGETALLAIRDLVAGTLEVQARSGVLSPTAAEAVERILTRFTPILDWKVIGPFPRTTAQIYLNEPSIDFSRPQTGLEGRTISWTPRKAQTETGRVLLDDFKAGHGDKGGFGYDTNGSPDIAAFAFAEIRSDQDRQALLLIGSSGSLIVQLNQKPVFNGSNSIGRAYRPDSDRVRVTLKKGTNHLLLRTRQGIGSWSFSVQVSDPSETLFATKAGKVSLDDLRSFAANHPGDAARGRAIFIDPKGVGCVKCHSAIGLGSAAVGPDLTGLALKYDRAEIIRSVLEPSARIATGYQPVLIAKTDGKVLTGLLKSETETDLELIDADARVTRVRKTEIDERRLGDVSFMPTGLVDTLSKEEFADLIAFLASLRTTPTMSPKP